VLIVFFALLLVVFIVLSLSLLLHLCSRTQA
jgi:hypothetical protein